MTTTPQENLLNWLRDAYAMEKQSLELCERQAQRIENYPELQQRVAQHAVETKDQIVLLERCFAILDEKPSAIKSAIGWTMGNLQAMGGMMAADEVVKSTMSSFVFENMEIASYTILLSAAQTAGEPEIARICEGILKQEEAMADWLRDHLPQTTTLFVRREDVGMQARH